LPLIVKNMRDRLLAFRLGSAAALCQTDSLIDQLQERVRQLQCEKATLARELCEARLEIAMRDQRDILAAASSPSKALH
jgi:hypothetical protein